MPSDLATTLEEAVPGSGGWTRTQVFRGTSQGAELWTDSAGQRVIVKHHPLAAPGVFETIGRRIQVLRDAGVPAPATRIATHGEHVLLIHDYLPGRSDPPLSASLMDDLIDILGRAAGLADESAPEWSDVIRTRLTTGKRHRTLQGHSQETRALLERVCRVGNDPSVHRLTAPDLVHFDLHTGQLVSDDGRRVSGIIDWDAVRSGDRAMDLANIAFTSLWKTSDTAVHEKIWNAFLSSSTHDSRVVYIHLVALSQVALVIREPEMPPGFDGTFELALWALSVTEQDRFSPVPTG